MGKKTGYAPQRRPQSEKAGAEEGGKNEASNILLRKRGIVCSKSKKKPLRGIKSSLKDNAS